MKIYYTYIWSLPCCFKSFNLSMSIKSKQWFSVIEFLQEWRQVSTKKCLKINLSCKRNFCPRYFSKYIYQTFFQNSFPPTDSKEKLAQTKKNLKSNLYQINSNRNLYHKVFDNSNFHQNYRRRILYQIIPNKKSLPHKISLVEVSFEIVLMKGSPQHFWSRIDLPKFFGRGVSSETFW